MTEVIKRVSRRKVLEQARRRLFKPKGEALVAYAQETGLDLHQKQGRPRNRTYKAWTAGD